MNQKQHRAAKTALGRSDGGAPQQEKHRRYESERRFERAEGEPRRRRETRTSSARDVGRRQKGGGSCDPTDACAKGSSENRPQRRRRRRAIRPQGGARRSKHIQIKQSVKGEKRDTWTALGAGEGKTFTTDEAERKRVLEGDRERWR